MAIIPSKQHIPVLTKPQVIAIRKAFYIDRMSYKEIQLRLDIKHNIVVSLPTLQKAIKGRGAFYSTIEDGIPEEVKKNRKTVYHYGIEA